MLSACTPRPCGVPPTSHCPPVTGSVGLLALREDPSGEITRRLSSSSPVHSNVNLGLPSERQAPAMQDSSEAQSSSLQHSVPARSSGHEPHEKQSTIWPRSRSHSSCSSSLRRLVSLSRSVKACREVVSLRVASSFIPTMQPKTGERGDNPQSMTPVHISNTLVTRMTCREVSMISSTLARSLSRCVAPLM